MMLLIHDHLDSISFAMFVALGIVLVYAIRQSRSLDGKDKDRKEE